MSRADEIWVPLVDEPLGSIIQKIQEEDPEIMRMINSPRRILAFRTFAYIRVGLMLGQLLMEEDVPPYDGSETWIELLLRNAKHHDAVASEVRSVAEEIDADPSYANEEPVGPDDDARARFREFAKKQLGSA